MRDRFLIEHCGETEDGRIALDSLILVVAGRDALEVLLALTDRKALTVLVLH